MILRNRSGDGSRYTRAMGFCGGCHEGGGRERGMEGEGEGGYHMKNSTRMFDSDHLTA